MKKLVIPLLCALLLFAASIPAAAREISEVSAPTLSVSNSSKILDDKEGRMNGALEFAVSDSAAAISDFVMYYASKDEYDFEKFYDGENPYITIERIDAVEEVLYEYMPARLQEKRSVVATYPLSLYADNSANALYPYLWAATGINLTLQPGLYSISITPAESFSRFYSWNNVYKYLTGAGDLRMVTFLRDDKDRAEFAKYLADFGYSFDYAKYAMSNDVYTTAMEEYKKEVAAEQAAREARPIALIVNGRTVATDSPPIIVNGRTLVPARALLDALEGYRIEWQEKEQLVHIRDLFNDTLLMELKINSTTAKLFTYDINDKPTIRESYMDVPAQIINGRTMIPVRFVAERLYCEVSWDEKAKAVIVESKQ